MTHTSDRRELAVLARVAGTEEDATLRDVVGELAIDEAAVARATSTAEAYVERFRLAARLTAHVRHRAKYRDVPLATERAFVFTHKGRRWGTPARTLRAFVEGVARAPADVLDGHARRGDFSRWIADVFGDQPLAIDVREVEERLQTGEVLDLRTALVEAISLRYEVVTPGDRSHG